VKNKIDLKTATTFVIANMVGTGVFTSLGFQLVDIQNPLSIIILWLIGGMLALFGAFAYSELSVIFSRSGGEYNFTREIYHPSVGFAAGWISMFVGFAAPVALASMALGSYLNYIFPYLNKSYVAIGIILIITFVHLLNLNVSSKFQNIFTGFKVFIILLFVIAGFLITNPQNISFISNHSIWTDLTNPAFAVCLLYVSFSYSGWNASTYITSEVDNPKRNVPLSLTIGTIIVTILYLGLNIVFMYSTPIENMKGKLEVGIISAESIFGFDGGRIMGGIISLLLISTVSSMVFAGPRVIEMMGEDFKFFKSLSVKNKNGIPIVAIIFQSLISIVFVITSTFEQVITYIGFTLNVFTILTVIGVFVVRFKYPDRNKIYKTKGYPFTPLIFIVINLWFLYYVVSSKPFESLIGLVFIVSGVITYFIINAFKKQVI